MKTQLLLILGCLFRETILAATAAAATLLQPIALIRSHLHDRFALHDVLDRMAIRTAVKNQAIFHVLIDAPPFLAFDVLLKHVNWYYDVPKEPPSFIQAVFTKGYSQHFERLCQDQAVFSQWIRPDITGVKSISSTGVPLIFLTNSPSMIKVIADHGGDLNLKDGKGQTALMHQLINADITGGSLSPKTVALILYGAKTKVEYTRLLDGGHKFLAEYLLDVVRYKRDLEADFKAFLRLRNCPAPDNYVHHLPPETQVAVTQCLLREMERKREELLCELLQ